MPPSLIAPSRREYELVRHSYMTTGSPALVAAATGIDDVRDALARAAAGRLPLAVRSGGHGRSTNDGGLVLDLGALREVEVLDAATGLVRIGAGARWGEVAQALDPHGLVISSGDHGDVGVGGLATVGGHGLFARRHGLTLDRVVAAEVVLADGTAVRADRDHHPELFWGLRGAGGALGVVTAFEFAADPVAETAHAELVYEDTDLPALVHAWAALVRESSRDLTSFLYVQALPEGRQATALVVDATGDLDAVGRFADLAPLRDARTSVRRYASLMEPTRATHEGQAAEMATRSGLLDALTEEHARAAVGLLDGGAAFMVQLRSIGGAVNDVAPGATAYAHRTRDWSLVAAGPRAAAPRLHDAWQTAFGDGADATYLNFETSRDEATLRRAYPPTTLARLHALRREVDPAGLFDANLPLPAP